MSGCRAPEGRVCPVGNATQWRTTRRWEVSHVGSAAVLPTTMKPTVKNPCPPEALRDNGYSIKHHERLWRNVMRSVDIIQFVNGPR